MTRNPFINALLGLLYIVLVVAALSYAPLVFVETEKSILIPIAMLSLFVFSAACMGYIFLSKPLQLFLDGQKKEAIELFIKTLVTFAVSAALLVSAGLYLTASL